MRICLVYDRFYPLTLGGAERWYRELGERLVAAGHDVTFVTLRHWDRSVRASVPGARVVTLGPKMEAYTEERRRILPPLVFGALFLWYLARHAEEYDVVHTASFPYFSLLAAGVVRGRRRRFRLVVDWHEVWTRAYWQEYIGRLPGLVGYAVQKLCARIPHRAFCFSELHARRLRDEGFRGEVTVLKGEYAGPLDTPVARPADPLVVFAGRHIPEKRVLALVPMMPLVRERAPDLRCEIFGDGPQRGELERRVAEAGLGDVVTIRGFAPAEEVDDAMGRAVCMVLPSRREGYGQVVVQASAHATPSVVVADPDNAATELVDEGENGVIAPSAAPEDLAAAILRVHDAGLPMRERTAAWFARNAKRLSLDTSLDVVTASYDYRAAPS